MHNYWLIFTKRQELAVDENGPAMRAFEPVLQSNVTTTDSMIANWVADWDRCNPNDAPHFAVEYCPKGLIRTDT